MWRIRIYLARHQGDLVAATILVRVGAHAVYAHAVYAYGASSTEKREVRGSNACQWAMIRDSLAAGCDVNDLRGITPTCSRPPCAGRATPRRPAPLRWTKSRRDRGKPLRRPEGGRRGFGCAVLVMC